jgi:hypothetical protein
MYKCQCAVRQSAPLQAVSLDSGGDPVVCTSRPESRKRLYFHATPPPQDPPQADDLDLKTARVMTVTIMLRLDAAGGTCALAAGAQVSYRSRGQPASACRAYPTPKAVLGMGLVVQDFKLDRRMGAVVQGMGMVAQDCFFFNQ